MTIVLIAVTIVALIGWFVSARKQVRHDRAMEQCLAEMRAERDKLADIAIGNVPAGLNELAKDIHEDAVARGLWNGSRSLSRSVSLCYSELLEAIREARDGMPNEYVLELNGEITTDPDRFMCRKPEGVAVEMADCLIRLLDWFGREGLDVDAIVARKMEYNKTRPRKHGKKF